MSEQLPVPCPKCQLPLALDPQAGGFVCENAHGFTSEEVAAMLPQDAPEPVKRPRGRPVGSGKKSSQQRHRTQPTLARRRAKGDVLEAKEGSGNIAKIDQKSTKIAKISPLDTSLAGSDSPTSSSENGNDLGYFEEPSGDVRMSISLREPYVEVMRDLAAQDGITLRELVQQRMDWWFENEFALQPAARF